METQVRSEGLVEVHPSVAGARRFDAQTLWRIPRVGAPAPAPDGSFAVVPVTTFDLAKDKGLGRLWRVAPGAEPVALTAAERSASAPRVSPDGTTLAFLAKDASADEKDPAAVQVWVLPFAGGEARRLTELPLGALDVVWAPDGRSLLVPCWLIGPDATVEGTREEARRRKESPPQVHATEERMYRYWDRWLTDGRTAHLFRVDVASGEARDLLPHSTLWWSWQEPQGNVDVAPDGSEIAFAALRVGGPGRRLRSDVYRLALSSGGAAGVPVCLTGEHGASSLAPRYAPDGTWIAYGRREDPDFYADRARLWRFDRRGSRHEPLLLDWDRSPEDYAFDADGSLVFHAEDDARLRLWRWRPGGAAPAPIAQSGSAGPARLSRDGAVWYSRESLCEPPEAWRLAPRARAPERLTRFTEPALREVGLGAVAEMRFEGAEGEEVQAFLVFPPDFARGERRSLVHLVHGGPHGIFGDQWHWRWCAQAFAARGHLVACVNFQGSTSFGNDFAQRIQGAWGERPLTDLLKASDRLVADGLVDEARMAVAGGSYGGYLSAWITTQTNRFACAVNHAGVFDLSLMYASDVTWGRAKSLGGEIWEDTTVQDKNDPARHAAGMNTPMLVVHGARDYRVPADEALLCYGILKAKGVPARLLYFADENHWILKPGNSQVWYREVLDWLDRFLAP